MRHDCRESVVVISDFHRVKDETCSCTVEALEPVTRCHEMMVFMACQHLGMSSEPTATHQGCCVSEAVPEAVEAWDTTEKVEAYPA